MVGRRESEPMGGRLAGERNGRAKITEAQVVEMRTLYSRGWTTQELSRRFKVTRIQVFYIVTGARWQHVGGPIAKKGEAHG